MKKIIVFIVALVAMVAAPAAAQVTLYDQTNLPTQSVTPINLNFTATSASTTVNFQGYNVPGSTTLVNIFLVLGGTNPVLGGSNNILDEVFTYTPAPSNPFASQEQNGIYGTRNLNFGGFTTGSYDTFSQTVATTIGTSYRLGFSFSVVGRPPDNGLRVSIGNLAGGAVVPEPSTWAMMVLGFGALGFVLRRRRRPHRIAQLA